MLRKKGHADARTDRFCCHHGSTKAALVAARRYCEVIGLDYVPALIERAKADDLEVNFQVGDAQNMPFSNSSFDLVLSVYGVQFAPDQDQAAREMLRVCRPGGLIGLATPLAEGWSGDFFATQARHMLPPVGTAVIENRYLLTVATRT